VLEAKRSIANPCLETEAFNPGLRETPTPADLMRRAMTRRQMAGSVRALAASEAGRTARG